MALFVTLELKKKKKVLTAEGTGGTLREGGFSSWFKNISFLCNMGSWVRIN